MTIITTEIQKWKRNKIVWCILALTLLLGAFAIERACSISRSSPFMDSFGDLYTLAFKNLSSLFLPIVLGMFATTLFFDEHKNDTMKELLIIPITKAQLYFSKVAVVILMSVGLCLITFLLCVVGGLIAGGFPDLNAQTLMDAGLLYLAGGILIPIAMLPIVFLSTLSKGYILPIGATLLYLIPVVIAPAYLTFYVLPAVISLLGSYMICREEQEDTLKSLRLIPVDEVKLTLAKMILAFVFSVLIYLLLFAITFLVEAVLHLKALSVGLVLENLKIYFLDGVGVFFAISPIIALVARMKKGYWLALVFAEIYSFAGLFASMSQQLKTVYPMTAVFNISGYYRV